MMKIKAIAVCLVLGLAWASAELLGKHCSQDPQCRLPPPAETIMNEVMPMKIREHEVCVSLNRCPTLAAPQSNVKCVNGQAGEYSCKNVDLLAFVPLAELGSSGDGNDIWGWTDPETGKEYALAGCADGTSFVDISDPVHPVPLAFLPTETFSIIWRDIKVYNNYAFIVSEATKHGMQVFDLTRLRDMTPASKPLRVRADALYTEFGSAHNIVINEETGFAYAVGTKTCRGGLHMVDIRDPLNPTFAGCYSDDGYCHDAQCVIYRGPDANYQGREICFMYDEDTLTIVDVTDKSAPQMLSRQGYDLAFYTHQGWLTEDQQYLMANDELDEKEGPNPHTRSMIWDVRNLAKPVLISSFYSSEEAIDHNLYIKGNLVFETNYCAGLRVLNIDDIAQGKAQEVAYFDVAPDCNVVSFQGSWSNFPYYDSGVVVVQSIELGLFVLRVNV